VDWEGRIRRLEQELAMLRRDSGNANQRTPAMEFSYGATDRYRGITTGVLNKGSSVGVTRYGPGTTTPDRRHGHRS
jgi:hypothetical protein